MTPKERHAFLAGFYAGFFKSGEGYNGEVPFSYRHSPIEDKELIATAKQEFEKYVQRQRTFKTSQG